MQKDSLCEKRKLQKVEEDVVDGIEGVVLDEERSDADRGFLEDFDESPSETGDELSTYEKIMFGEELDDASEYEPDIYEQEDDANEEAMIAKKAANEKRRQTRIDNKTVNYVNPDEMEKRIAEYYSTNVMTDELAMDIRKICDRLSNSSRFVNYTYRDEMAADAFLSAYKSIFKKKYKVNCGFNPFSYVTQVAFHSMVQRIKTEHKERDKTEAYREVHFYDAMRDMMDDPNGVETSSYEDSEFA